MNMPQKPINSLQTDRRASGKILIDFLSVEKFFLSSYNVHMHIKNAMGDVAQI
jgi:hypothetical protein